jgi:murein L,D-transpeptidase YcbB/YkuD
VSTEVRLRRSIPILIMYRTAFVAENGEVRFLNDIYGFDATLQTALEQRHTGPFIASP